jgi:hypothetical protein
MVPPKHVGKLTARYRRAPKAAVKQMKFEPEFLNVCVRLFSYASVRGDLLPRLNS